MWEDEQRSSTWSDERNEKPYLGFVTVVYKAKYFDKFVSSVSRKLSRKGIDNVSYPLCLPRRYGYLLQ